MGNNAGRWIRVSGDTQSEEDQIPDINGHCSERGYSISDETLFTVHGKSAYHGAQDPDWQRVVQAFKDGIINVIVIWMVDRLDRRNILTAIPMVLEVLKVNGRIEFTEQPECNLDANDPDINDKVKSFTDRCHAAWQESQLKSKRVKKAHNARRAVGALTNRCPFGFTTEDRDYEIDNRIKTYKALVPNEWAHYIKPMFEKIANGETLLAVAKWLDSENVPTNSKQGTEWSAKSISQYIKNPTYRGITPEGHECEALVSDDLWNRANKILADSPKGKRGPRTSAPPMLSAVECGNCGGRIYRNGKYYRCAGKGTKPKGCGTRGIAVELLDAQVSEQMSQDMRPIVSGEWIEGSDKEGRLKDNRIKLNKLDIDAPDYDDAHDALMTERREIIASGDIPGRWVTADSGETFASRWASLDNEGRQEFLANDIRIIHKWLTSDDGELISVVAILENAAGMNVEIQAE
jgi:DNA invertase Pin-like site-specific DNA recombinase